jgi:hypothetical protein
MKYGNFGKHGYPPSYEGRNDRKKVVQADNPERLLNTSSR